MGQFLVLSAGEDRGHRSGPSALIYYWVDTTVAVPANTGNQRVARQMARGLLEAGHGVVPVKWGGSWNSPCQRFPTEELSISPAGMGPTPDHGHAWTPPADHAEARLAPHDRIAADLSAAERRPGAEAPRGLWD